MNSEEKLMAKKLEYATKALRYSNKNQKQKYAGVGSDNERQNSSKHMMNKKSSQLLKTIQNNSEYNENSSSNDNNKHVFLGKKLKTKSSKKRIESPVTDFNDKEEEKEEQHISYYEKKTSDKMPKKNLRLDSGNYRMEPLNQYPFPLTPLDKASNKPIEFEENMAGVKCQSTRNK